MHAKGSLKTVSASSTETLCLEKFRCRLFPVPCEYQIHSDLDTLSSRGALFLENLACLILEPSAEVEEVVQGQLPAGDEIGGEDLIAGEDSLNEILLALKVQNLDRLGL